jgi:hypothetical protein
MIGFEIRDRGTENESDPHLGNGSSSLHDCMPKGKVERMVTDEAVRHTGGIIGDSAYTGEFSLRTNLHINR